MILRPTIAFFFSALMFAGTLLTTQPANADDDFIVLDEAFNKLTVYKKDGGQKQYSCFPQP